jgi:DNA-binding transcriptional MocR family regulator
MGDAPNGMDGMYPKGGGMRGGPALVCVAYDSNGIPRDISGLPDFAERYVEAIKAERARLRQALEQIENGWTSEKDPETGTFYHVSLSAEEMQDIARDALKGGHNG